MKVRIDILSLCMGDVAASAMRASLLDSGGNTVVTVNVAEASAQFDDVAPGAYTAHVVRQSDAGTDVDDPLNYPFVIVQDAASQTHYGDSINVTVMQS